MPHPPLIVGREVAEKRGVIERGARRGWYTSPVPRCTKPRLEKIEAGQIDPSLVIAHRVALDDAPAAYKTCRDKADGCVEVVLQP